MQKGSKQSDEAKRKMSETRKGRPLSEQHKAAIAKAKLEKHAKLRAEKISQA